MEVKNRKKAVIIHYLCDHSPFCSGIEVCKVGAITYNEEKGILEVDWEKCTGCGLCAFACPAGAIVLSENPWKTQAESEGPEFARIFLPKYGAEPMHKVYEIDRVEDAMELSKYILVLLEIYSAEKAICRSTAIDYIDAGLWPAMKLNGEIVRTAVRKINADEHPEVVEKLEIKETPALLFIRDGKILGKMEGSFTKREMGNFLASIQEALQKNPNQNLSS